MPSEPFDPERVGEIRRAIASYAHGYASLERIQRCEEEKDSLIPVGDQKTGAIGEFYALLYAKCHYEEAKLAKNSQQGWDIKIRDVEEMTIQVKTVSAFSTTRRISPLHYGRFHKLWVLFLDERLQPAGFWRFCHSDLPWNGAEVMKGKKSPKLGPDGAGKPFLDGTGSQFLRSADNEVCALNDAVEAAAKV